jgi:hypothetical protein
MHLKRKNRKKTKKKNTYKKKEKIHQRTNLLHLEPSSPLSFIVVPSL